MIDTKLFAEPRTQFRENRRVEAPSDLTWTNTVLPLAEIGSHSTPQNVTCQEDQQDFSARALRSRAVADQWIVGFAAIASKELSRRVLSTNIYQRSILLHFPNKEVGFVTTLEQRNSLTQLRSDVQSATTT